jgi:hypothetical protein
MKSKIIEHVAGIAFVSAILISLIVIFDLSSDRENRNENSRITKFINVPISNYNDPFQRALFKDVLNIYFPGQSSTNDSLAKQVLSTKESRFNEKLMNPHTKEHLTTSSFFELFGMYLKFLIIYIIAMLLTYYGVQTLAVWRFVSSRQTGRANNHSKPFFSFLTGILYFFLFSPAYVIAYSIRTEFNTDTVFFMVILGVMSNGLLVMYANKFHAFLTAESRKGYIETALAKNLISSWNYNNQDGIAFRSIFKPIKKFKGHVFDHIFMNARHQYLSTIKEQSSFLITGLVIIEMALNIHGHLNYEMLRQILYKNYDKVIIILLGIFYTVKMTEIFADYLVHRENLKFENRD